MTITQLKNKGHVYLEDLKDVVFTASPVDGTTIKVLVDGSEILKHKYYADPDGEIHLDLRELVQNRTSIGIPSGEPYTSADDSNIYITVNQDGTNYAFTAFGYEDGLRLRLSDIDYLRIPADYKLLLTIPNMANALNENSAASDIKFHDHRGKSHFATIEQEDHDGYILSWEYPVSALPAVKGKPFRLLISHQDLTEELAPDYPELATPLYEISEGEFEQYAFLTPRGSYENIPMAGDLKNTPEISFENAQHASGLVKVQEDRSEVYEQNTGWLTKRAAETLSKLLSSAFIYHLEGGEWKRILIETPEITISKRNSLQSFTFTWRHVETN